MNAILNKLIYCGIIIAVAMFFCVAGKKLLKQFINRRKKKGEENNQINTIFTLVYSVWKYTVILFAATSILNVFGLGVTANSILAAAGVGGVALGIGAQDFIKDIVNGFTIILENQFAVGDYVQIGDIKGTVVNITLRTTHIRGVENEVYMMPNSSITSVVNYYKNAPNVVVDVYVANEEQIEDALSALHEMCDNFKHTSALEQPHVLGVCDITYYGAKISVSCNAKKGSYFDVQYALFRDCAKYLNKYNIEFFKDLSLTVEK